MPVIWPNVWARDAMGTARKRLVEKTSERPRRIAHLVSFLVATGGGKILMHVAALVEVGKLAHQASRARNYEAFGDISEKPNDACANCGRPTVPRAAGRPGNNGPGLPCSAVSSPCVCFCRYWGSWWHGANVLHWH